MRKQTSYVRWKEDFKASYTSEVIDPLYKMPQIGLYTFPLWNMRRYLSLFTFNLCLAIYCAVRISVCLFGMQHPQFDAQRKGNYFLSYR